MKEENELQSIIGNIFEDSRLIIPLKNRKPYYKIYTTDLDPELVSLNPKGQLLTNKTFDRELLCPNVDKIDGCQLEFMFHVIPDYWIKVFIILEDINDNKPKFLKREKIIKISETIVPGYQIPLQTALDEDLEYYGVQSYALDNHGPFFSILYQPMFSLTLVVLKKVDYEDETNRGFNLTLKACDGGTPVQCDRQKLYIIVTDVNDNSPIFDQAQYHIFVKESLKIGSQIFIFNTSDLDSGLYGKVRYKILPSRTNKNSIYFSLIPDTGELILKKKLDAKVASKFMLNIEARDEDGKGTFSTQCQLTIKVQDENDHSPSLSLGDSERLTVKENAEQGEHVGMVIASDGDLEDNGKVICTLDRTYNNYLALDRSHNMKDEIIYRLLTKTILDKEKLDFFIILIICHDFGKPERSSSFHFNVSVVDINEYSPFFDQSNYSVTVSEDIPIFSKLITLKTHDEDKTSNHTFSIETHSSNIFRINPLKGVLKNIKNLDREQIPYFILTVLVKDNINGIERTGTTTLYISVSDVNDHTPVIIGSKQFTVRENEQVAENGNLICELKTYDQDDGENATVMCNMLSVHVLVEMSWHNTFNHSFYIEEKSCSLFLKSVLDREKIDVYKINVIVFDLGVPRKSSIEAITIMVDDENDNYPLWRFPYNSYQYENNISSYMHLINPILRVTATDNDSKPNANISYHFVNSNTEEYWYQKYFSIEMFSGNIFMKDNLFETGLYYLQIQATDNGYPPLFSEVTVVKINLLTLSKHETLTTTSQMNFTLILVTSLAAFSICVALMIGIVLMWRKSSSMHSIDHTIPIVFEEHKSPKWNNEHFVDVNQGNSESLIIQPQSAYTTLVPDICNMCAAEPLIPLYKTVSLTGYDFYQDNQMIQSMMSHQNPRQFSPDADSSSVDSGHGPSEYNVVNDARGRCYHSQFISSQRHCNILPEESVLMLPSMEMSSNISTSLDRTNPKEQHQYRFMEIPQCTRL